MLLYTDPEKLRTCYVGVRRSTVSTFLADQQQLLLLANLLLDSWTTESRTEGKAACMMSCDGRGDSRETKQPEAASSVIAGFRMNPTIAGREGNKMEASS